MTIALIQTLKEYGLTQLEACIYAFLLKYWPCTIDTITKQFNKTWQEIIIVLHTMMQQWCLEKKWEYEYGATSIESLIQSTKIMCRNFKNTLPCFQEITQKYNNIPRIRHYQWLSWLKKYYDQQLLEEKDVFAFLWTTELHPALSHYLYDEYVPKRVAKWVYLRAIVWPEKANEFYLWLDKKSLRETIMINHPLLHIASGVNLFWDDNVWFALFGKNEMSATIIQSKKLYKTLKSIFDLLWSEYHK